MRFKKVLLFLIFFLCIIVQVASAGWPPPVADFTANETTVCTYEVIQFNDTTDYGGDTPIAWWWLFGDSTDSHLQNATHYYDTVGTFDVSFWTETAWGEDWENKTGYITVIDCFSAEFTANVTCQIGGPMAVAFDGVCEYPYKTSWHFGDGNTSDIYDPVNTYYEYGTYTVNHTCHDAVFGTLEVSKPDYITVGVNGTYCECNGCCFSSVTVYHNDNTIFIWVIVGILLVGALFAWGKK